MEKSLKQLANNQVVISEYIDYGEIRYEFYSYGSLIAVYYTAHDKKETLILTDLYDYSRTTSKWLKVFLNDICYFDYKDTNELRKLIKQGGKDNVIIQVI